MKIVDTETVIKWIKTTTKFSQYKKNYLLMLDFYKNEFPEHFVILSHKLEENTMYLGPEEVKIINTPQGKIIQFALRKELIPLPPTKFGWKQKSYFVGCNEEILNAALINDVPIKIVSHKGKYLKKPYRSKSGIKEPLYITRNLIIEAIENDWIIGTKVGLKIFAIPIYLMPHSYEVSKVSGQKQLIDFGQAT